MRLFHGLLAYRGGKDLKDKAIAALQGVEICASDFPIGDAGIVVKGDITSIYARDCWSDLAEYTEYREIPAHYEVTAWQEYYVDGPFTEIIFSAASKASDKDHYLHRESFDVEGPFTDISISWVEKRHEEVDTYLLDKRVSEDDPITLDAWYKNKKETYAEFFCRVTSVTDIWIKSGCTESVKQQAQSLAVFLGLTVLEVFDTDNVTELFSYDYI